MVKVINSQGLVQSFESFGEALDVADFTSSTMIDTNTNTVYVYDNNCNLVIEHQFTPE